MIRRTSRPPHRPESVAELFRRLITEDLRESSNAAQRRAAKKRLAEQDVQTDGDD